VLNNAMIFKLIFIAFLFSVIYPFELDILYELPHLPALFTFELIENLFENQITYCFPIIFAYKWSILKSKKDQLSARFTELVTKNYVYLEQKQGILTTSSETLDAETIFNKIRAAAAKIFGSETADRIDADKSLIQQWMDSLMGVALNTG
ncbi:unnamed protein product, partial [Didymodactylos carnosus]